ncbi:hypothetical protein ACFPN2_08480 [Steroidobacter flavus]|uniref:Uncharacterized protein n=1 Tax=Steroidobacter flavus TaxID=1842136 RepID=A0ABV8SNQ4_9GAMM
MSGTESNSSIYRSEAIEYRFREQENIGIVAARMRWSWPVILISLALLAACVTYMVCMHEEIGRAIERRMDR